MQSVPSPPPFWSEAFAPWVESTLEVCRRGRRLVTAINHRDGAALQVDESELAEALRSPSSTGEVAELLRSGRFLATDTDDNDTIESLLPPPSGLIWRGADDAVRRWHDRWLHRLFRSRWLFVQAFVAVAGVIMFATTIVGKKATLTAEPGQIPGTIALGLVAVTIHELGHALATVHYGRHVRSVGLRLHLGSPAFFVESVDALLLTRRQRLIQAAAGPWAEWLATTCALTMMLLAPDNGNLDALLHRFVIVNTIGIGINLLPFVGLDGSLLLSDLVREPDLSWRARRSLMKPATGRRDRWLVSYALANSGVAALLLVSAVFFWWKLFGELITRLVEAGTPGFALLAAAVLLATRRLRTSALSAFRSLLWWAQRALSRLVFRLERRWRVEAMLAFRSLPEIAALDPKALGVLAGHLHRKTTQAATQSHVYRRNRRAFSATRRNGCIQSVDQHATHVGRNDRRAVYLPHNWRELVDG